ncbi:MAG: tetratricopeptide repeat protein [Ignavibacteria bacterium]|nr:tetratricopeptide repeat protein [Ignavibacteria bacterium]
MDDADLYQYYCKEGLEKYESGNYKDSIYFFTKAIEANADNAIVFAVRGLSYGFLEKHYEAIADFSKALEIDPNYEEGYINRGNVYKNMSDYSSAHSDFTKAIEINPYNSDAYYNRGNLFLSNEDFNNAITDYNKAIDLNPNDSDAYRNRSLAFSYLGKTEESYKDLQKSDTLGNEIAKSILASIDDKLKHKSEEAFSYHEKGAKAYDLGKYDDAINYFGKVIEINSNVAEVYFNRGLAYSKINDYSNAISDFSKAIDINSQYSEAYLNRSSAYILYEKNVTLALTDLQIAVSLGNSEAIKVMELYNQNLNKYTESKSVRFNGLYFTKEKDGHFGYLRFYSNNTVLSVTSNGNVNDLKAWFKKESFGAQGKYEIVNDKIEFIVESTSGRVSYKGTIVSETEIHLNIESFINGYESERTYSFVEFTEKSEEKSNAGTTLKTNKQNIKSNRSSLNVDLFYDLYEYMKNGIFAGAVLGFFSGFIGCFIKLSPKEMPFSMPFTYTFYGILIGAAGGFIFCIIKNSASK